MGISSIVVWTTSEEDAIKLVASDNVGESSPRLCACLLHSSPHFNKKNSEKLRIVLFLSG